MAVVLRQMSVEVAQIQTAINASQNVARRNVIFEVEGVEQSLLSARLMTHHVDPPMNSLALCKFCQTSAAIGSFSTESVDSSLWSRHVAISIGVFIPPLATRTLPTTLINFLA